MTYLLYFTTIVFGCYFLIFTKFKKCTTYSLSTFNDFQKEKKRIVSIKPNRCLVISELSLLNPFWKAQEKKGCKWLSVLIWCDFCTIRALDPRNPFPSLLSFIISIPWNLCLNVSWNQGFKPLWYSLFITPCLRLLLHHVQGKGAHANSETGLHCVKLKLIWYNWENTCVKTHIIWPCWLWRLADANDGCFSFFLKNFAFSLHLHVSLFFLSIISIVFFERATYAHMCV